MRRIRAALCAAVFFVAAFGQAQTTGTISGTIQDSSGAVLPGASVVILNEDTGISRSVQANAAGHYSAPALGLGNYRVTASRDGFQAEARGGIVITVGREAVVNFALQVGAVTQTVEVIGEAPLVQTTSATLEGLVDDKKIRDLPLNARSYLDLALLQSGVVLSRTASSNTGMGTQLSISGARPNSNNFKLDGIDITDMFQKGIASTTTVSLGVEGIREFTVLTHNFSAEYGKASGGVVNAVTRSGTNRLTGSVFEFIRNDNLDARKFFDRQPVGKPEFKRNQFGFSVGGPIRKDRSFFFGNYEALRDRQGQTALTNVPTATARTGFIRGVQIDPNKLSPFSLRYMNLYPLPSPQGLDNGDGTAQYITTSHITTNQNYVTVRVDHKLSDSDSFFARYTFDKASVYTPAVPALLWAEADGNKNQYVTVEETKIFSPSLLNVARFGLTRQNSFINSVPLVTFDPALAVNSNSPMVDATPPGSTSLGVNDAPRFFPRNVFEMVDNVTYTKGAHSFKGGLQIQRDQQNIDFETRLKGRWSFTSIENFAQGISSALEFAPPSLADPHRSFRQSYFGFYGQDDVRIGRFLTLNLGLRYEYMPAVLEKYGRQAYLDDSLLLTGSNKDIRTDQPWYFAPKDNWGPRVGLAWDVFGTGRTAVRAGAGIYNDLVQATWISSVGAWRMAPVYPVLTVRTLPNGSPLPFPLTEAQLLSIYGPNATTVYQIERHPKSPYSIHFNLSVQQQFAGSTVVKIGYSGSRSNHMPVISRLDAAKPIEILSDGTPRFSLTPVTPNPNYTEERVIQSIGQGSYHSLQLEVNRKFARGFQVQGSYTFGKSIDDKSGQRPSDAGGGDVRPDFRVQLYRGLSDHDVRHNLTINATYDLPSFAGIMNHTLGGWQVSSLMSFASGQPFTVVQGSSTTTALLIVNRPNLVSGASNNPVKGTFQGCTATPVSAARPAGTKLGGPDIYFDPCAFAPSSAQFFGNVGRNTIIGPGLATMDFSLVKNFGLPFREGARVQFRSEFFNILNRANFSNPSASVFDSQGRATTSGRIVATSTSARQIQFGLKLQF
jgi:carboxypeptidase family protein/TonB-dependent receptor-like protein